MNTVQIEKSFQIERVLWSEMICMYQKHQFKIKLHFGLAVIHYLELLVLSQTFYVVFVDLVSSHKLRNIGSVFRRVFSRVDFNPYVHRGGGGGGGGGAH
jgi:hypothetical protein